MIERRIISTTLVVCGMIMLLIGMGHFSAPGTALAMPQAQPSPRPTINPTPMLETPVTEGPAEGETGRITGTIIDLSTGAPARGVTVEIGGVTVVSDANGNYDTWLLAGSYTVALKLAQDQGIPAQGPQSVQIAPGGTTVLHLSYRSRPAANSAPLAAPVSAPAAAAVAAPSNISAPAGASSSPRRLPRTAEESNAAWLWLVFGVIFMFAGGMVGARTIFRPALTHAYTPDAARPAIARLVLPVSLNEQTARDRRGGPPNDAAL